MLIESAEFWEGGGSTGVLWLSDGTAEGTRTFSPQFEQDMVGNPTSGLVELEGQWFFGAGSSRDPTNTFVPFGLYVVSPQEETVEPIRFFEGGGFVAVLGANEPTVINDTVFFGAHDGSHGYELWRTDGTVEGTRMVRDIDPGHLTIASARLVRFRAI